MKHAILGACSALVMAGGLTVSAQTVRPPSPQPTPSTPARTDSNTITVTGCLQGLDATGAPALSPATATRYLVANIEPATPTSGAEPGERGSAATEATAPQYVLMAEPSVNLAQHVNHKVRLTGKVTAPEPSTLDAMPADPPKAGEMPRTRPGGHDTTKALPTLTVSSVTMVAATCTPPSR